MAGVGDVKRIITILSLTALFTGTNTVTRAIVGSEELLLVAWWVSFSFAIGFWTGQDWGK